MKKYLFLSLIASFLFLIPANANAQPYDTGVGARLSTYLGLTLKHNISDQGALEGIAELRYKGFIFTGLYEHHFDILTDGLRLYVGAGAHIGIWTNPMDPHPVWGRNERGFFGGVDGILGIEYTFGGIPINISADYKPGYHLFGFRGAWTDNGGLAIRYTF